MKRHIRAIWVSRKERSIWCCDFSGFGSDQQALRAEIEASQAVINQQSADSLLVAVDLCQAKMTPEIEAFFKTNAPWEKSPIHKMAILGVSDFQRLWYRLRRQVDWPNNARFFSNWEKAKDWLVTDIF